VSDEERGKVDSGRAEEKLRVDSGDSISVPMMTDVFTWTNVQYDVTIKKGETRRLLDNISGFVAPGKLTALMGESGAGKVRSKLNLCGGIVRSYSSPDHVAECSGGAPGGWCCHWREARERISYTQRFPGTNVSLRCFLSYVFALIPSYCSGYVQQMDTHVAQATVREALLFSAKLRQPPSVPLKEKEA
jgi:ATP-binding cassette subfamily G (WHITE) protein 2 (SNQ2)